MLLSATRKGLKCFATAHQSHSYVICSASFSSLPYCTRDEGGDHKHIGVRRPRYDMASQSRRLYDYQQHEQQRYSCLQFHRYVLCDQRRSFENMLRNFDGGNTDKRGRRQSASSKQSLRQKQRSKNTTPKVPMPVKKAVRTHAADRHYRRAGGNADEIGRPKQSSWRGSKPVFRVAIVGRPNAGKSTLFNALCRGSWKGKGQGAFSKDSAMVSAVAGTTRDVNERMIHFGGMDIALVDTGGLEDDADDVKLRAYGDMGARILSKTEMVLQVADVIFFLVDAKSGITEADMHFSNWLRRKRGQARSAPVRAADGAGGTAGIGDENRMSSYGNEKEGVQMEQKVIVVANKTEGGFSHNLDLESSLLDCNQLGWGEPLPISAEHGEGIGLLASALVPSYEVFEKKLVEERKKKRKKRKKESEGKHQAKEEPSLNHEILERSRDSTSSATMALIDAQGDVDGERGVTSDDEGDEEDDGDDEFSQEEGYYSSDEEEDMAINEKENERVVQLAIVGRPNVGKSSVLNAVLKEDRVLVGPTPGLTRDSVAVEWEWDGRPVRLVDTAGIRKAGKRKHTNDFLEDLAVKSAMRAISMAQVVLLVLDGQEGVFRRQELTIAEQVANEGKALVVCANKADLVNVPLKEYAVGVGAQVEKLLPNLGFPPVLAMSAMRNPNIPDLMATVISAHDRWRRRVPTATLNRWIKLMERVHPPPRDPTTKRQIRLKYITQVKSGPPSFAIFTNSDKLPESYQRFLLKNLQEEFDFYGMAPRLVVRKPTNVFGTSKKEKNKKKKSSKTAPPRRKWDAEHMRRIESTGPGAIRN